jgi:[acyl-carrier-protein] S-malonyltransferase
MDAASCGAEGTLFVRGLSRDTIEDLCERHDAAIEATRAGLDRAAHNFRASSLRSPRTASTLLLSGIDACPVIDVMAGLHKLAAQVSTTVQWADCLQGCIEADATAFLELGPGHALSDMAVGTYRDVSALCLDDFKTIQGAKSWLRDHATR